MLIGNILAKQSNYLSQEKQTFINVLAFLNSVFINTVKHFLVSSQVYEIDPSRLRDRLVMNLKLAININFKNSVRSTTVVVQNGLSVVSVIFANLHDFYNFLQGSHLHGGDIFNLKLVLLVCV